MTVDQRRSQLGHPRRGGGRGAIVVAALALLFTLATTPASAQDSKGADFWLAFPGNLGGGDLSLFITGETATSGTVSISGLSFGAPFTVAPGAVTTVGLPSTAGLQTSDVIQDLGVHVTAGAAVTVYGLNRLQFTTDAYLGLPTDALGTDYIALGYKNVDVVNGTQLGMVATQDATTVMITPTVTTDGHTAGLPYSINLNQGQTYLLRNRDASPADLSGTLIESSKPIAVFGGHECANIPPGHVFCDHLVEQLPPTTAWGKSFVSMPLATRTGGDTFRVLASQDATTITLNGATVATLNGGQLHEQIVTGPAEITADKPVLVMQYSNSTSFDGVTSDPFQMMIPPHEQFLAGYTVSTPASGFALNFINVVAPDAAAGAITLDGSPIPAASFTAIGASGFSGAQVPVGLGSHTLSGPMPFGVHSYGFDIFDSYGYPGGLSLSEVALVASVALTPESASNPINTEHCVTATVNDQNGSPLPDIRVDFGVAGVHAATGFAFTSASGEAPFCYTGTNVGDDIITATVGTFSDTATKTWSEVALVASVALTPESASNPINTEHCVTATVNDQNGSPLPDIRVDFGVAGVHAATGFAFTSASGEAPFCYTGTNVGDDIITATVGTFSDTATKTWSEVAPTEADLSVTETDSPDPVRRGRKLTYTATVSNLGPADATDATLKDTLPGNMRLLTITASQGSCSRAARLITCSLGTVTSGGSATVTIEVRPKRCGFRTNVASVMATETDPDPTNNIAQATTRVIRCGDDDD